MVLGLAGLLIVKGSCEMAIAELMERLEVDEWRSKTGFSAEMDAAHEIMFAKGVGVGDVRDALGRWLHKYQPCLFGKAAAIRNGIEYCILLPEDLRRPDDEIRKLIQESRLRWKQAAINGDKSAFVILAVSQELAVATPNEIVLEIALALCSLYLLREAASDVILLEDVRLEVPGRERQTIQWPAGVNYFCAQGDRRWWQDHRVPGGMAFSINSVGHLAKSGALARMMKGLLGELELSEPGWGGLSIDSLPKSLVLAMKTIDNASAAPSGKATRLLDKDERMQKCPIELPPDLDRKDHCSYMGRYHTDITIPSEYFRRDIERPSGLAEHNLDFTYLYDDRVENPDFQTMGRGVRVRSLDEKRFLTAEDSMEVRRLKARGE
jgi:hypothetical protein